MLKYIREMLEEMKKHKAYKWEVINRENSY